MTAHDAFAAGELAGALALQRAAVRDRPADPAARLFLVELLTFGGELRAALAELKRVPSADPGWPAWRDHYRTLLKAEHRRAATGVRPLIIGGAPPHARRRWRTWVALRDGNPDAAVRWADRAEAASPDVWGFVDGREFHGLRDADDRFASVLEGFLDGRYVWVPWEVVRRVALREPARPHDRWVRPADVRLRDGTELGLHLPLIYPDSAGGDGAFAVGLDTDFVGDDGGPVRCVGGKLLLCGDEELMLGDCRMIEVR